MPSPFVEFVAFHGDKKVCFCDVFPVEFVAFNDDLSSYFFVAFPVEFVAFPVEFVAFPVEFVAFPVEFVAFRGSIYKDRARGTQEHTEHLRTQRPTCG